MTAESDALSYWPITVVPESMLSHMVKPTTVLFQNTAIMVEKPRALRSKTTSRLAQR